MYYRNGREAKNGDKVVQLSTCYSEGDKVKITAVGVLVDAVAGISHCNGSIVPLLGGQVQGACICDCLHADDLADILKEKGLDKRPPGK